MLVRSQSSALPGTAIRRIDWALARQTPAQFDISTPPSGEVKPFVPIHAVFVLFRGINTSGFSTQIPLRWELAEAFGPT